MELPFEDNSFDHVYVIEAACHAPDKVNYPMLLFLLRKTKFFVSLRHSFRQNVLLKFCVYSNQAVHLLAMIGV
jgi:hypothetical protein